MLLNSISSAVMDVVYRAAWLDNINIGDEGTLIKLLNSNGFDGASLVEQSSQQWVKDRLRENTDRAFRAGACGGNFLLLLLFLRNLLIWYF
jgi:2-hydroxychromene-2-carboxylate isomerase